MKQLSAVGLKVTPWRALWMGALLWLSGSECRASELYVVASIKPLALLAREIVGTDGTVETVMSNGASPHHYALRVSDVQRLETAQLVIWVGPELERFLVKPLARVDADRHLTLSNLETLEWPSPPSPAGEDESHHNHGSRDPHLWLNPRNGARIALALAEKLAREEPELAQTFTHRAQQLAGQLRQRDTELHQHFLPLRSKGFVVFHDGYQHFVQAYGLRQLAAITVTPEQRPGARHLYAVRQRLAAGSSCILVEPYYESRLAQDLATEFKLPLVPADPLGKSESTYLGLIDHIAEAFSYCLVNAG